MRGSENTYISVDYGFRAPPRQSVMPSASWPLTGAGLVYRKGLNGREAAGPSARSPTSPESDSPPRVRKGEKRTSIHHVIDGHPLCLATLLDEFEATINFLRSSCVVLIPFVSSTRRVPLRR
jgi:hypothetical protein